MKVLKVRPHIWYSVTPSKSSEIIFPAHIGYGGYQIPEKRIMVYEGETKLVHATSDEIHFEDEYVDVMPIDERRARGC